MANLNDVRTLRDEGRFTAALKLLEDVRVPRDERLEADVLRADLLERTGRYAQSRTLMRSVLSNATIKPSERHASELVMARLEFLDGEVGAAIACLQRLIRTASPHEELERVCWAELLLLQILADHSGPNAVASVLSEARSHIMRAGNPTLVTALHLFVSETEAKRGLLGNARRHLEIGKRGLSQISNSWLEAYAENIATALETMRSSFDLGFERARSCLELAEQAGARNLRDCAVGNISNLAYLTGDFENALKSLLRERTTLTTGSGPWQSCTGNLASVALAQGRLGDCSELLDEADAQVPPERAMSYGYRHTQFVRLQCLAASDRLDDALTQAESVLSLAARSGDHLLNTATLLMKADVLRRLGHSSEAQTLLRLFAQDCPTQSPEFLARYEQVLACALAVDGQLRLADRHRLRSQRTYSALQHRVGEMELAREWGAANDVHPTPEGEDAPHSSRIAASTLADVASILSHIDRPALVAVEIIHLLDGSGSIETATVERRTADGETEVLEQVGTSPFPGTDPSIQRLWVGYDRGCDIEVRLRARTDWESLATINAVSVLLSRLHDLERSRVEREEAATLWPIDELSADAGGPVTVGHMSEILKMARRVAAANISVLITGESGTGKEIVARAVHEHSPRAIKPFIPFNCAAVPRDILESQLFGHRRGAFTGADRDNLGMIRSAREGTLFLDEVGDLSLDLQPKLLRFLESGEICPVGESTPFNVDVRIVAATNTHLEAAVREGRFREDLYYRLNVVRLSLKPLRERRDEIPTLVNYFTLRATEEFHKDHMRVSEETMERLLVHPWPGNVRQLQNEIRRMVAIADPRSILQPEHLSAELLKATAARTTHNASTAGPAVTIELTDKLPHIVSRIERQMIQTALKEHGGKVEEVARALGISRKGLYLKRQRLGL